MTWCLVSIALCLGTVTIIGNVNRLSLIPWTSSIVREFMRYPDKWEGDAKEKLQKKLTGSSKISTLKQKTAGEYLLLNAIYK